MDWIQTLKQVLLMLWLGCCSGTYTFGEDQRSVNATVSQAAKTVLIEFKSNNGQIAPKGAVPGEVLAQYADGSLLLLTEDGQLWTLEAENILQLTATDTPMVALSQDQIYDHFQEQVPDGFKVHKTKHYVLIYNTSEIYVKWVAELFEHLYRNFYSYWKVKGIKLEEPRFPLVAIVFSNKASYLTYAEREIGETAKAMIGYFNLKSNRMVSYDLTGVDGMVPAETRPANAQAIRQYLLSQPQAERTVATIIHEAVHQLAYNSGLQVRLADNPLWLSEGMAMFFETPDRKSKNGWGSIGNINTHNLSLFAQYVPNRPVDSLQTLITDDSRLRDAKTAPQAYPESWALTYFLMTTKSKQFAAYLKELAQLTPLGEYSSRERMDAFKKHFGENLDDLNRDLLNFYRRR